MSSGKSVLVLGAGELGMAVVLALARKALASKITVMVRPGTIKSPSPSKSQDHDKLRDNGIELLGGDIEQASESDLSALFNPFHTIISCTGYAGGGGAQAKIARAVLAARVLRYIPWQFGVDYDVIGRGGSQELFDEQLDVRDTLKAQSTTEWIIVSTGIFMSFMFAPWWGMIDTKNKIVRGFGSWNNRITATTAGDIGTLTAEMVFAEPKLQNEVVFIAGDTVNYMQLADIIDKVHGETFIRELWTSDELQQQLDDDPNDVLRKYRTVWARGMGVAWDVHTTFNAKNGIKTTGIEQYAADNL